TGECSALVTAPTASDNCEGPITGTTQDPTEYTEQGTYTIHWIYDDGNGNMSTQEQTVVVDDVTPPETPILADVILGECSGTPSTPTTTDNCKGTVMGTTSILFPKSKQGKHTIIWTFDDGNGNVTTAYQNLIVDDITAPVADVEILPIVTAECSVTVSAPTATDNCKGTIVGTTEDPTTYNIQGTYTIHWTYDDGNGNTSTQSQTVVVDDITPPETPILADVIVGECSGTPSAPTTIDNCKGTVIGTTSLLFPKTKQGKHTIIWTFDDGNGNVTSAYQNLIVDDTTAPVADVETLPTVTGECSVSVSAPTATDNCKGTIQGTTEDALTYSAQGTYTIHWTYDDGNGNTSTQTQTVVVDDITPPEITGTIAVTSVEGCDLVDVTLAVNSIAGLEAFGLSVSDACTAKTALSISSSDVLTGTMPKVVTRTYTITDANDNSTNFSQTILLVDTQKPTIICPEDKNIMVDSGKCTASGLILGTPVTSDNCSIASVNNDAPEVFAIGSTKISWTVTDASGNITTCSQMVNVKGLPVAVDDNVSIDEDDMVSGNVMENDEGLCTMSVLVKSHTEPEHGSLTIDVDGSYTYTPEDNYQGTDQFTYQICSLEGNCSEATVTIAIKNSNDMPLAKDDTHTIQLDLVLQGDVAENDIISGDGGNVWTIMDLPAHGTISFHPDGTYTYTPNADFLGSDSFKYKLCDADGDCSQAKVSIRIEDILLPNQILTPNGDDVNDTFIIVGIDLYPQNKLTMYNRWGNIVYQKNNYQNEWEGNSNVSKIGSKSLPVGTYYYLVDYGKNRHKTGFVYLDR
ncbi:MAG: tandem-95 repeat protein, partial [Verrucomicrobia bacterium]|nr:tandem-95 repeat protein [Prolixibacteraceae bacterium]